MPPTLLSDAANLQRIHWHRTAAPAPESAPLHGHQTADVIVVGGGLTGTRTALGLAENGADVILIEAHSIGFGASGRSGGQCNPIWRATPDDLRQRLGTACADRLIDTTLSCADALFDDIRKYQVECDPGQAGWVQAAHCKSARNDLERLGHAWNAAGAGIEFLDRSQTQKKTGSPAYGFALFHPRGGHVQPLSLTRGFARAAARLGARLYDQSPVTAMVRDGAAWTLSTARGSASAPRVILTTNAYSDGLWPRLSQTYFPMVSISLATAPLSENLQKSILPGTVTLSDTRRAIYYCRYDRDRRLIFGCVGSADNPAVLGGLGRLKRGLLTVFPNLHDIQIESTWSGRIAVTPEMMPHLHEPAPGVLAALGFSGRGIAMTSVMARTLVKKTLGAADDTLPFPVSPLRPIPLHGAARRMLPLAAPAMALRDRLDTLIHPL